MFRTGEHLIFIPKHVMLRSRRGTHAKRAAFPPHAAEGHDIVVHHTVVTRVDLVVGEANENGAVAARAHAKIRAILRISVELVLAQFQRLEDAAKRSKTLQPTDIGFAARGLLVA